jgi:hypothetical protein
LANLPSRVVDPVEVGDVLTGMGLANHPILEPEGTGIGAIVKPGFNVATLQKVVAIFAHAIAKQLGHQYSVAAVGRI